MSHLFFVFERAQELNTCSGVHRICDIGSSLTKGPFRILFRKGAVLYWGPKKGSQFRELRMWH